MPVLPQRRNPTNSASVIAPRQQRDFRSQVERKRRHTIPRSSEQHPLTVKLRGRLMPEAALTSNEAHRSVPMRPSGRRGRTLSSRARGANQTTPHGPLERLLEVTLTTTTVRVRPQCGKRGRLSLQLKRAHRANNEAALRLVDRCLTEAGWARAPSSIKDAAGRTRTRMRRTKTPARQPGQLSFVQRRAKRRHSRFFATLNSRE
jgi:hypothetical protein